MDEKRGFAWKAGASVGGEPNLVRFITLTDGRVNTPYAALIGQDV